MHPVRPEGGGRPPQSPRPTAPNITEILRKKEEEPLSPAQQRKKKRTLYLLTALSVFFFALAVYLTIKAFSAMAQL